MEVGVLRGGGDCEADRHQLGATSGSLQSELDKLMEKMSERKGFPIHFVDLHQPASA